jgi:Alpha-L-arabinofuranosidase
VNKIQINANRPIGTINKNIYGHFAEHLGRCIYQGLYVGESSAIPNKNGMRTDVVNALKNINLPLLRWPGGCFADEYHWEDGIGPKMSRKRMVNTNWGGVVEDNSFGTHEFLELCEQVGCEPYINANVGSGTVREMAEWVEYLNSEGDSSVVQKRHANGRKEPFNVKYWGVGNESWGCGGNMRPEYYADEYRRYQTYCRNYGKNKLYRIACGASDNDYNWTDVLMKNAGRFMDAITLHHYTIPTGVWQEKGSATEFDAPMYYQTLKATLAMDEMVQNHLEVMNRYDKEHRVGLIIDEWGTWYDVEPGTNPGFLYQQNTMRDAIVAALNLDIFNKHCNRVVMTNIAQTVNVLQAIVLTEGDKMVLTPTYHVFDLFKNHHDALCVDAFIQTKQVGTATHQIPMLSATASIKNAKMTITLTNTSADEAADVEISLEGFHAKAVCGRMLTGKIDALNDFDNASVNIKAFDKAALKGNCLTVALPPCAVTELILS